MALLYLFGALLYATRTPERYFPGRCDFVGQSHQLFHVCVVVAAIVHYLGITYKKKHRIKFHFWNLSKLNRNNKK